jgi:hypothetical protein
MGPSTLSTQVDFYSRNLKSTTVAKVDANNPNLKPTPVAQVGANCRAQAHSGGTG